MRKIKCLHCNKETDAPKVTSKFCSLACSTKWRHKNQPFSKFVKGHKIREGLNHSDSFKEKRKKNGNPVWKGDDVTTPSIHDWVRNNFNKSGVCECCGKLGKTEWSNKKHDYQRDREGWQEFCRSCHQKYDYKNGLRVHHLSTAYRNAY